MKSILLTTTALVAFAGAAAADGHASVSFNLSATLGYNDTVNEFDDNEIGFYFEGNLETNATAELDNGLTAGAYFEITVNEDNDATGDDFGIDLESSDFVLSLEAENGGLFFGDTGRAAEKYFVSAGDMEADSFSTDSNSNVIRGDIAIGPVQASASYSVNDAFDDDDAGTTDNGDLDAVEQLGVGFEIDAGLATITAGYQEDTDFVDGNGDFNQDEVFGISVEGTVAGATITVAYAEENANVDTDEDETSIGIEVSYPFGPVTATAYYVEEEGTDLNEDGTELDEDPNFGIEINYADGPISVDLDFDDDQGTQIVELDGSYDVGNGLTLFAGYATTSAEFGDDPEDEYYVAAKYDLGGGADVLVSFAEGEDNTDDEIGADDYQEGTTVELNFAF